MKLLVVSRVPYEPNGISSVIRSYYLQPSFSEIEITFVFPAGSDEVFVDELKNEGFNVVFLNKKRPMRYYRALKKLMKSEKFDAVQAHGSSALLYFEIHAAKKAGVPIRIAHSHSSSCKYKFAHKLLKPFLNRELTHAFACSDLAGKWLFTGEYEIFTNGIDVEKFRYNEEKRRDCRSEFGFENELVLGHVANMEHAKNQIFLLEIFAELLKTIANAKLLFVGDGPLRSEIEAKISELGIGESVVLTGRRKDTDRLYQAMDVFLLPSLYEGLPVTLIEAQAAGLKCFASERVTRQADITGNVTYLPIGNDDFKIWAQTVAPARSDNRSDAGDLVRNSGYNAASVAKKLKEVIGG